MKEINLEDCHKKLLILALHFHRICEKHHIPYYMTGGTMLGAIRHKGFIPWDDDMDFVVPREYFEQLLAVLEEEKVKSITVVSSKNANYPLTYIKLEDANTWIDDPQRRGHDDLQTGINIDIFPLESCSSDVQKVLPYIKKKKYDTIKIVSLYLTYVHSSTWKTIFRFFIKLIYKKDKEYWLARDRKIYESVKKTGNDAYVNLSGIYEEKEIIKKELFGKPKLYSFEDTELYGVEKYDEMLKGIYGDYMALPPISKRHIHANKMYEIERSVNSIIKQ